MKPPYEILKLPQALARGEWVECLREAGLSVSDDELETVGAPPDQWPNEQGNTLAIVRDGEAGVGLGVSWCPEVGAVKLGVFATPPTEANIQLAVRVREALRAAGASVIDGTLDRVARQG